VARGSCWVSVGDGVRHRANQGDVIVLPYGDRYTMGGQTPVETVSILNLLDPMPWEAIPVIRHGGGGERTDVVCGYLHSEHSLFDPAMRALPPVFIVRLPPGPAAGWVQASIAYSIEETAPSNRSTSLLSTRLPELVLIEVLRVHLSTPRPQIGDGFPRCAIPSSHRRCRCCTLRPDIDGPSPNSQPVPPFHDPCSTNASVKCWAGHRSAT
jgi:Cupin